MHLKINQISLWCLSSKRKKKFEGFKEKPSYDFLFNTGLYLINKKELRFLKNQKLDMDDFILKLKKKKKKSEYIK